MTHPPREYTPLRSSGSLFQVIPLKIGTVTAVVCPAVGPTSYRRWSTANEQIASPVVSSCHADKMTTNARVCGCSDADVAYLVAECVLFSRRTPPCAVSHARACEQNLTRALLKPDESDARSREMTVVRWRNMRTHAHTHSHARWLTTTLAHILSCSTPTPLECPKKKSTSPSTNG